MSELAERIIRQIDHANCHPFACEADREEAVEIVDEHLSGLRAEILRLRVDASNHAVDAATVRRERDRAEDEIVRLRDALAWYGEQARLCRLIHSEGDAGRHALADDGGKRAREVGILAAHAQGFVDDLKGALRLVELEAEVARLRAAVALAADRLDSAAGRITAPRAAFGVREWAREARARASGVPVEVVGGGDVG